MSRIPKFKTDKEIAEFWDTHDLVDFEDELEIAKDVVFVKPERPIPPKKKRRESKKIR